MLRFRPARDGSPDFGGARNCSSWRARSGGRSLNFGCRCPTGACHTAASAEGCRDADDTRASCAKAPLAANARIAAQIAASRITVVVFAWNVSIEREFRNDRRPTLDGSVRASDAADFRVGWGTTSLGVLCGAWLRSSTTICLACRHTPLLRIIRRAHTMPPWNTARPLMDCSRTPTSFFMKPSGRRCRGADICQGQVG
jgi:hypothetical protein